MPALHEQRLTGLTPTPEQGLDLGAAQLEEGRPPVAAGRRAGHLLHLTQQGVHLGRIQPPSGTDTAMTGHARDDGVEPHGQRCSLLGIGEFIGDVRQQPAWIGCSEHRRQSANQDCAGT